MSTPVTAPSTDKRLGFISRAYRRFQHASAALESPFLLLIRVYWGWQFTQSGWGRLHNLDTATGFFASLGLPFPEVTVILISVLEVIGGILMIAGLASRFIGLLLACDMMGAYLLSDHTALKSIISDPGKFYNADPFTFLFASLILLIFGAGRFSADYIIWRRKDC